MDLKNQINDIQILARLKPGFFKFFFLPWDIKIVKKDIIPSSFLHNLLKQIPLTDNLSVCLHFKVDCLTDLFLISSGWCFDGPELLFKYPS